MDEGLPILAVLHDAEGGWAFLCETTEDSRDGRIVCLGCMIERFPFLGEFASLAEGHEAVRKSADAPWEIRETLYE
jgi:hypothetical protein